MTGEEIRKLRGRFGESREKFARRLGLSVFTVITWERGKAKPSDLALQRLREVAARAPKNGQEASRDQG